jgi:O-antigen ligase
VCWGALAFMVYAVLRYLTSDIEYVARQEMIQVLMYGFILFAVITNLHRLELTQIVTVVLLALGTLIALYGVYQFLAGSDRVLNFIRPEGYHRRGSGTFISPNSFACYLAMLLPLGLAYTLSGRLSHVQKVLVGYASLVIFAGIVSAVSRGGWFATCVAVLIFFFLLFRQRDYRLQSLLLAVGLIVVAGGSLRLAKLSEGRKQRMNLEVQGEDIRLRLWQPALAMWKDHFWFGVGPDHFDIRFRQYRPADDLLQYRPGRAHNDYVNTLADWGLMGFALVGTAWGLFFWEVFRSWKYIQRSQNDLAAKRSNKSSFVLGATLGLVAILVHSFVDFNFHVPALALVAVILLGLVTGHFRFATERYWYTVRWPLKITVSILMLAGISYLGVQTWRHTRECYWQTVAEDNLSRPAERIAALKMAFAVEPRNPETSYDIGEALRLLSWEGSEGFQQKALEAMDWFQKARALNSYHPYPLIRYGMCLDWLERYREAEGYFKEADRLDPNGFYTAAHLGWHYFQVGDYVRSRNWFERSMSIFWHDNPISQAYLQILKSKIPPASPQ